MFSYQNINVKLLMLKPKSFVEVDTFNWYLLGIVTELSVNVNALASVGKVRSNASLINVAADVYKVLVVLFVAAIKNLDLIVEIVISIIILLIV